jgi:two-component system phosphate regulon response regulator PhoB
MTAQKILIVEDAPELATLLAGFLEEAGYQTITVGDGREGLKAAILHRPDLILLDVMLPGMVGTDVCRAIKKNRKLQSVPIIFLTACHEEVDRVVGLELGADDYVIKPFSMRELLLRIQAVLRRTTTVEPSPRRVVRVGPISIQTDSCKVALNENFIHLSAIEYKLLLGFAEQPKTVLSRDILGKKIWGKDHTGEMRTVDTHINRLRIKLGEYGGMIKAVRGFGYLLETSEAKSIRV